jgi:hypothetical protein
MAAIALLTRALYEPPTLRAAVLPDTAEAAPPLRRDSVPRREPTVLPPLESSGAAATAVDCASMSRRR